MKYIGWIWRNMVGIRANTMVRMIAGCCQVWLGLLMVWLSKQFIDITIRTGTASDILRMVVMLVATVVGGILLRQLYYYMSVKASVRQSNAIRLRVFSSLFHRQMYEEHLHSGDVTQRLSKDIDTVAEVTTSLLPQFVVTGVQLISAFALLYTMDHALALSLLLVTPLLVGGGKLLARKLRTMTLDIRRQESTIQVQVQESVEHTAVLTSLGSEPWVTDRLDTMQQELRGHVMRRTRFTIITRLLLGSTFALGYLAAFVWGGLQLREGTITFGVMTSFLQLVGQVQHPIMNLLNMLPRFFYATASVDRLEELENSARHHSPSSTHPSLLNCQGIRFEDVSFCYAGDERRVVDHFSHDFRPGSKTVIMGETGAGKSTLFRLLLAFIQPQEGRVMLYGADGEKAVGEDTRPAFVFVPQGNTLMSGSVRYNLLLAKPEATDDELRHVIHTAMADFVWELPEGIDTAIGERGIGLSEGQAQRIAIARSLLRPGDILLLDEISSALDEGTERELFSRLLNDCPQKTMLFITHRPAVAKLCDETITISSSE